jgi:RHS repeat-associated protein
MTGVAGISYGYDTNSRCTSQSSGGITTRYLWDGLSQYGDVVVEFDQANVVLNRYILAHGRLIAQVNNDVRYFLADQQGSTRLLTDSAGQITSEYDYSAFGELTDSPSVETKYLYTGQQFDQGTGMYSLRARYYTPGAGRFVSRDVWPVDYGDPWELNRYGYVGNNPGNYSDPSGWTAAGEQSTFLGRLVIARNVVFGIIGKAAFVVLGVTAVVIYALGMITNTITPTIIHLLLKGINFLGDLAKLPGRIFIGLLMNLFPFLRSIDPVARPAPNPAPFHTYSEYENCVSFCVNISRDYPDCETKCQGKPSSSNPNTIGGLNGSENNCRVEISSTVVQLGVFHHAFIRHTDRFGNETIYRGGSAKVDNTLAAACGVGPGEFGFVCAEKYSVRDKILESNTVDVAEDAWAANQPERIFYPLMVGTNACDKDCCFDEVINHINEKKKGYNPLGPNSNTVAHTFLARCSVPAYHPDYVSLPGWYHLDLRW